MAGRERSAAIGSAAEDNALTLLRKHGLQLLARNFRCRQGEIDLVMRDGETLVFVEVRHRRSGIHGSAAESVTLHKRRKLMHAAAVYLARHPLWHDRDLRFDLITLDGIPPSISWLPGAITNE
jgi:putative endonuclease